MRPRVENADSDPKMRILNWNEADLNPIFDGNVDMDSGA